MPSRLNKYLPFLVLLLLFIFISGCGYRLRGTGELREDLQRVAILSFTNKTFESRIENDLFNALVDEFARSKNLKVVAVKDADLLVNGTISAVENHSISYSSCSPSSSKILCLNASTISCIIKSLASFS